MTTEIFCFYLQNKLIQISQTGGQLYSDTSPLVFPDYKLYMEQHVFKLSLIIEGASEKVSQLIMPKKSIYNKKTVLMNKNVQKYLNKK